MHLINKLQPCKNLNFHQVRKMDYYELNLLANSIVLSYFNIVFSKEA